MTYSHEVETMCTVKKGPHHGPAPIPEEGKWVKAYEIKEMELETLKERLKEARREKALAIAQADGDSRHDNFGFEQAEIQERAVIKEINDLTRLLQDAEIVEEKANSNTVDVGSRVEMELDYGDGDVETVVLKLQPLPSDESGVVTLNSPIGRAIFGQKENFYGVQQPPVINVKVLGV